MRSQWFASLSQAVLCIGILIVPFSGCERKERVVDVRTPGADVTVDRNVDSGEVEINVDR